MSQRRLPCPACARELVDETRCVGCGHHLSRLADRLIGEGALRSQEVATLAVRVEPAPLARLGRQVRAGGTLLSIRPARAPLAALLPGMTVYSTLLVLWLRDAASRPGLALLGCIVPAAMAVLFAASTLWHLIGRESLRIDGERLVRARGLGFVTLRQALPRQSHIEVELAADDAEHTVVVRRHGEAIALGRSMGLDAEHADWLARAVRKALAEGGDPEVG